MAAQAADTGGPRLTRPFVCLKRSNNKIGSHPSQFVNFTGFIQAVHARISTIHAKARNVTAWRGWWCTNLPGHGIHGLRRDSVGDPAGLPSQLIHVVAGVEIIHVRIRAAHAEARQCAIGGSRRCARLRRHQCVNPASVLPRQLDDTVIVVIVKGEVMYVVRTFRTLGLAI
jgi:hypothetical protein